MARHCSIHGIAPSREGSRRLVLSVWLIKVQAEEKFKIHTLTVSKNEAALLMAVQGAVY